MTLPMSKGYYTARASGTPITFGRSENGNTQIAVEFTIEDAEFAGETITWIGHFTDKTAARSVESLQIAGWQGEDLSELEDAPGSTALPDVVSLTCEAEEYNGEWTLKVKWVNRPGGGGRFKFKEQIGGNDLKAFGAQLRATVKAVRASGGAPRAPRQQSTPSHSTSRGGSGGGGGGGYGNAAPHPNAPGSDEDIPF